MSRQPLPSSMILEQLQRLGCEPGDVLIVHTSFRQVGPIQGGPLGLIQALCQAIDAPKRGTLVMPTMTDGLERYDRATTPSVDMGIVAETFWRQPGVLRSGHPGASFAAYGPQAAHICQEQPLSPPHGALSPVGFAHEVGAKILLLGVDHSENTTLHLAEALAQVPYSVEHPCMVELEAGIVSEVMIAETDHCCEGFRRINAWLDELGAQRVGLVGYGESKLVRSADVISVALAKLKQAPLIFLCSPGSGCEECEAAHQSASSAH